jgi:hypothetical protein
MEEEWVKTVVRRDFEKDGWAGVWLGGWRRGTEELDGPCR